MQCVCPTPLVLQRPSPDLGAAKKSKAALQLPRNTPARCIMGRFRVDSASRGAGESADISRRALLSGSVALSALLAAPKPSKAGLFGGGNKLQQAFDRALAVQDDPVALEKAWTECLAIAPDNAAIWSNRGTVRLGLKRYSEAKEDLEKARSLEKAAYGYASGFVLVALGNAKSALGDYGGAIEDYDDALEDSYPGISSLAYASSSLAKFQLGNSKEAIDDAKKALAEAPEFADVQAALAGLLWTSGDEAGAKEAAETIGGTDVLKTFVQAQQEASGWPPRIIAAVNAFLAGSKTGSATDFDGSSVSYNF